MKKKPKDILEDIKEVDRKVRTRIVYDKLEDIKEWAKTISELKQKTQMLLEELGVETEDIKRLIDYATNSQEAQLSKEDLEDLKEEVKDLIKEGRREIQKVQRESPIAFYTSTSPSFSPSYSSGTENITTTTNKSVDFTVK